ncbi:MAG: FAD-binding oxidoreductase [Oscillochloris sp.]|nr:FAD-binding oxidoreductase [Oscillochloris sp.]
MAQMIQEHDIGTRRDNYDVARLERRLQQEVRGEVRFDDGTRALYATDASVYRQPPIGVVIPRTTDDLVAAVAVAREFAAPVLPRGCGTSLAGQTCNVALVLDCSKYLDNILEVNPEQRRARVQPGVIRDHLVGATAPHGLTFGPDTSTHKYATMGGMLGNNSCGVHSVLSAFVGGGARASDSLTSLDILTYDGLRMRVGATSDEELERIIRAGGRRGEIYAGLKSLRDRYADLIRKRIPDIPRRVSGYNLDDLLPEKGFNIARALVGSEGTLATFLEAEVLLVPSPPHRVLVVLGYPSVYEAADHIAEVMAFRPTGCEGIDDELIRFMKRKKLNLEDLHLLPEGGGWLLVEFGGASHEEACEHAQHMIDTLQKKSNAPNAKLIEDEKEADEVWGIRESGLGATAFVPNMNDTWPGWEDSAVAPEQLGDYLRDLRGLYNKYGYEASLYGHFGQGCVHTRIDFDLRSADGIETYRRFTREAAELVVGKYGGSLSGEHGDGQARGDLLEVMYGKELIGAFREFKSIWDPDWKMNPGKVVDPFPRTSNLRLGTDYQPKQLQTHFQFPEDQGDFARATLRCVGVGKCRQHEGGTMCPSYQVLHEEEHTTRGRAHLLFEMLQGDLVDQGWKSEHVKDSLDLCLSCKGCKGDCPVQVDIATYKAEFLSHYYEGKLRPRQAIAFGLIFYWARLAAIAPQLANFATHTPFLRDLAKFVAGVAPAREVPAFAPETFKRWFRRHKQTQRGRIARNGRMILWPDTFNNHFHPGTLVAAVETLEDAGYEVDIPQQWLCCGRPLYDFGMLDQAKKLLQDIVGALRADIRSGTPIVGIEPSCVAVFRDELGNLFPHDQDARRLAKQTFTLGEFLVRADYEPPKLRRKAIVHGHCHHKAIMRMQEELALFDRMGLDYEFLDSGCCGMAGAFGFERGEKYAVSIQAGERVLLPQVRDAERDTLIITDGFSCKEQIAQTTDRRGMHLAQVIQLALHDGEQPPSGAYPEQQAADLYQPRGWPSLTRSLLAVGAGTAAAAGVVAWGLHKMRGGSR